MMKRGMKTDDRRACGCGAPTRQHPQELAMFSWQCLNQTRPSMAQLAPSNVTFTCICNGTVGQTAATILTMQ